MAKSVRESVSEAVDEKGGKLVLSPVQVWLDHIAKYDSTFKPWQGRVEKILKRYRDDGRQGGGSRFNILWSNVQTLVPATFSRLPQPDVSRRFRDSDPVGRVASLILERALEYEIQHYSDYRSTLKADVYDRFLGGRGTAWVRYEPHMRATGEPTDGVQVTEDIDEPGEEIDYECAPVDYVHWKDFGHTVARTWEEVTGVWRKVYMSRDMMIERFGEEIAAKVPYDASPTDKERLRSETVEKQACVYEIWDKTSKKAYWLAKSVKQFLDERDDPLKLEEFFPCPKPLFATLTNDSLIPVPDFTLYQDQAKELDVLSDRIDGLIKALKVSGCYDSAITELGRLFSEGENNALIPVKNWAAFAEKNGLQGAISLVDLKPIAEALISAYNAMEQVKQQVYDITGLSDIVRGQSNAAETATAQQIKGQYASLRLRHMQEDVSRFATDLLRLKAQIMCGKFTAETLAKMSSVDQLAEADKQHIGPALELLLGPRLMDPQAENPNPVRSFRIDVAADTLVQIDEQAEKEARVEFLTAVGMFLEKAVVAGQTAPEMTPLLMELLKFGVTGFKVGKTIEGAFDETVEQLKQAAAQPKPEQPDPTVEAAKIKADTDRYDTDVRADTELKKHAISIESDKLKHEQTISATSKPSANVNVDASGAIGELAQQVGTMVRSMQESGAQQAAMLAQVAAKIAQAVDGMAQTTGGMAQTQAMMAQHAMTPKRKKVTTPEGRSYIAEDV